MHVGGEKTVSLILIWLLKKKKTLESCWSGKTLSPVHKTCLPSLTLLTLEGIVEDSVGHFSRMIVKEKKKMTIINLLD